MYGVNLVHYSIFKKMCQVFKDCPANLNWFVQNLLRKNIPVCSDISGIEQLFNHNLVYFTCFAHINH